MGYAMLKWKEESRDEKGREKTLSRKAQARSPAPAEGARLLSPMSKQVGVQQRPQESRRPREEERTAGLSGIRERNEGRRGMNK